MRRIALRPLHVVILLSSVLYFVLMARPIAGSYFNSYPFIPPAGFDSILEGFALFLRLSGGAVAPLPLLGPPVFVLVTALDAALRANGLLVVLSIACGIYAMHLGMMLIADRLHVSPRVTAAFIVASLFMPLAYFRLWILSDPIAIAFMVFSLYGLFRHEGPGGRGAGLSAAPHVRCWRA